MEATVSRPVRILGHPAFWTLALLCIVGLPLGRHFLGPSEAPLPLLGTVPAFHFTDQDGSAFGPGTLAGRPWVANFIFTRCPTVCPVMTEQLAALLPRLDARIHLVSFSVEPDFDTPKRLRDFAQAHGAVSPRWHFLTGDGKDMQRAVTDGFKISLAHEGAEDDFLSIVHGVHLVLVDAQGNIRGYYDSTDPEARERLVRDTRQLGR
jgi:protein SCO1/2